MVIISLNVNDFGGRSEHLQNYKIDHKIDWDSWKQVKKKDVIDKLKGITQKYNPTVFILQEFELNNSKEPMDFIEWMKKEGYEVRGCMPFYRVSMTLFFIKNDIKFSKVDIEHNKSKLDARDYAIKIEDYVIYGTHVPLNSKHRPTIREDFWDDIIAFYEKHKNEKTILLGDFNTNDKKSKAYEKYKELIEKGACDLWLEKGNSDNTSTEYKYKNRLDYVFVSEKIDKSCMNMDIDGDVMNIEEVSDHAAIFLKIN